MNFSISKLHSFKELYTQAMDFMKAISDGDLQRATAISKKNINPMNIYFMITDMLKQKIQLQLKYDQLKKQYEKIAKQLEKAVKKEKNAIPKDQLRERQETYKIQVISLLENDRLEYAKQRTRVYALPELQEIIQQLSEYRFINKQLNKISNHGNSNIPVLEQERPVFSKKRATVELAFKKLDKYKKVLNTALQEVLRTITSKDQRQRSIQFAYPELSNDINSYLSNLFGQLFTYQKQKEKSQRREQKITEKIQRFLTQLVPHRNTKMERDNQSFYSIVDQILQQFIKSAQKIIVKPAEPRSGIVDSMRSESNYEDLVPIAIKHSNSQNWLKTTQFKPEEVEPVLKLIYLIDQKLKFLSFPFKTNPTDSRHAEILRKGIQIIDSFITEALCKKAGQQLQETKKVQEDEALIRLRFMNMRIQDLAQLKSIRGMVQIAPIKQEEMRISLVCLTTANNIQLLLKAIQQVIEQRQIGQSSNNLQPAPPHQSSQLPEKNLEDLRQQLEQQRKIITELRENNSQLIKKISSLESQLVNSYIVSESQISELSPAEVVINQNKKQILQLQQLLRSKTEELNSFNAKIPKLISVKVEEEKKKWQLEFERAGSRQQELANKLKNWEQDYNKLRLEKEEERNRKVLAQSQLFSQQQKLEATVFKIVELQQIKALQQIKMQELQQQIFELKTRLARLVKPLVVDCGVGPTESFLQRAQVIPRRKKSQMFSQNSSKIQSQIQAKESFANEIKKMTVPETAEIKAARLLRELEEERKVKSDLQSQLQHIKIIRETQQISLTRRLTDLQAKDKLNQEKIKTLTLQISSNLPSGMQNNHLFPIGFIFDENSMDERLYLINTLTSYVGHIRKTQLLYRFDPFNKTNPHRYVDKHPHIVAILKTIYGKYVAAYSRQPIDSAGTKVGFGLLMALWNRRTFEILPSKKPVTYDDYFIIFGNSELRLKSQQTKVFSNFGINNAYFNSGGAKIDAFLGEGSLRQMNFDSYEIYELDLQNFS